jgi:hypothetical protein
VEYEKWGKVTAIDLEPLVNPDAWELHWSNWKAVLKLMTDAQDHAMRLKRMIEKKTKPQT